MQQLATQQHGGVHPSWPCAGVASPQRRRRVWQSTAALHSQQLNPGHRTLPSVVASAQQGPEALQDDRVIASVVSIGLNGSLAVGAAQLAGVDLWREWSLAVPAEDSQLVLLLGSTLVGLDWVLFGAPWHKLPQEEEERSGGAGQTAAANRQQWPFNLRLSSVMSSIKVRQGPITRSPAGS